MDARTAQALNRFGLGRRGDQPLPDDPVAWLRAQVEAEDTAKFDPRLPTTADGLTLLREQQKLTLPPNTSLVGPVFAQDVKAQTEQLLATDAPFRERLVWFWANHFTVSIRRGGSNATIGPFIREAIRPNVTGSFYAMILAVMRHPAMIMYLDNNLSAGPNSQFGKAARRGLNENLARECLELHTLGPPTPGYASYTQADVTALATILTGWSVELERLFPGYQFRQIYHEPGTKTLLGRRFPAGEPSGLAALELLAHHPSTHHHLATRLVRHFVSDTPDPADIGTIEGVLRDTQGDLAAASLALIDLESAWTPLVKLRTPQDYAVAALRALDLPPDKQLPLQPALATLGQPLWNAPLPNGWADTAPDWTGPEAMIRRIDWSFSIAARSERDAMHVAETALGPLLTPRTRDAIRTAGSRQDALTLLLTAPEFQRR